MTDRIPENAPTRRGPVVAIVGVLMIGVGAWWWAGAEPSGDPPPAAAQQSAPPAPATTPLSPRPVAEPVVVRAVPGAPNRVVLPKLGVKVPVVPIKTEGASLVPPSDPMQLGWWSDGAKPGAEQGSALITGHTYQAGAAALNDLERLKPGDRVRVDTNKGTIRYEVKSTKIFTKGDLARQAQRLFDQTSEGRLVLITCEDWDGTRYLSNVVVTAYPV